MSGTGSVVLAVALGLTAPAMCWPGRHTGTVRAPTAGSDAGLPQSVLTGLGIRPGDAHLTVVQFSTAFCGPCRATRARLAQLQSTYPGLATVHVDAESHLDAVRELDVRRTPTLLFLDRRGRLIARSSGAPRPDELTALVHAHAGGQE